MNMSNMYHLLIILNDFVAINYIYVPRIYRVNPSVTEEITTWSTQCTILYIRNVHTQRFQLSENDWNLIFFNATKT